MIDGSSLVEESLMVEELGGSRPIAPKYRPSSDKVSSDKSRFWLAEWLDSPSARLMGVGASIAATWLTARHAISLAFFKNINKAGGFTDLQDSRDKAIGTVLDETKKGKHIDTIGEIEKIHAEYERGLQGRRKLLNMEGMYSQWRVLKPHQRTEVLLATGAVAAVALGAILTVASNRDIAQKQDELEQEHDQQHGR